MTVRTERKTNGFAESKKRYENDIGPEFLHCPHQKKNAKTIAEYFLERMHYPHPCRYYGWGVLLRINKILNEPPIEKYELTCLDEKENRVFRFAGSMEDRSAIAGYAVCLNSPELQQYFGSLKSLNLNDEMKNLETKYRNLPDIEPKYTYESGDDEYE